MFERRDKSSHGIMMGGGKAVKAGFPRTTLQAVRELTFRCRGWNTGGTRDKLTDACKARNGGRGRGAEGGESTSLLGFPHAVKRRSKWCGYDCKRPFSPVLP